MMTAEDNFPYAPETPLGRPPFEITEEVIKKAAYLASTGLPLVHIAASLGIHRDTLNEKRKAFPEFSAALERGKADSISDVVCALFENAKGGDFPSQKYFLNNRDPEHWKDRHVIEAKHSLDDSTLEELERELEGLKNDESNPDKRDRNQESVED